MYKLISISILILVIASSCNTVQKVFTSKRYKKAVADIESLNSKNKSLEEDTAKLGKDLRFTKSELQKSKQSNEDLNKKYNDLMNSSLSKTEQLNQALKNKSEELNQKELLLKEREAKLAELQSIINKQDSIVNSLNNILKNALVGFNSDELSIEIKNGKVYVSLLDKLLFKSGSANIESKGKDALKKLSDVLAKNTEIGIQVEGHTDNIPIKTAIYKDNWDLSVARATSIVRILTDEYKLEPNRITASGKGEFNPVASNETTEGRAKNRRTEIVLSPKLDELFKIIQKN